MSTRTLTIVPPGITKQLEVVQGSAATDTHVKQQSHFFKTIISLKTWWLLRTWRLENCTMEVSHPFMDWFSCNTHEIFCQLETLNENVWLLSNGFVILIDNYWYVLKGFGFKVENSNSRRLWQILTEHNPPLYWQTSAEIVRSPQSSQQALSCL